MRFRLDALLPHKSKLPIDVIFYNAEKSLTDTNLFVIIKHTKHRNYRIEIQGIEIFMRKIYLLTNLISQINWYGKFYYYALGLYLGVYFYMLRDGGQEKR